MVDIWDSIKETAKSVGKAGIAPAGVVWDLATTPFDDEDDDFGSVLDKAAGRAWDVLDPILNPKTATGAAVGGAMDAANWTLDNAVNEPISAFFTGVQHAGAQETVGGRFGALFSADDWAQAYEIAQDQSAGQSFATMVHSSNVAPGESYDIDPFDYENPYDEWTHPTHGGAATALAWSADVGGSLVLDPFYLGAKGVAAARHASLRTNGYAKLDPARRAELTKLISDDSGRAVDRVGRWANWTAGENKLGRPLTASEIHAATPELRKWSKNPRAIAALIEDANRIGDPTQRLNAVRGIIATAGGDPAAIKKVQAEVQSLPDLADALKNLRRGNVLDLKHIAADPKLSHNPMFVQHLERQLDNLNADGSIDNMVTAWANRLDVILDTQGSLSHIPGLHAGQANRALNRMNEGGVRQLRTGHRAVEQKMDQWVARRLERAGAEGSSLFIQKSLYHVPVAVVKGAANLTAGVYTKAPFAVSDNLRQTHFTNLAKIDAWEDSTLQLDAMMKIAHVMPNERMQTLSRVMLAKTEGEKQQIIRQVEKLSMRSLVERVSREAGSERDRINPAFVEALMDNYARRRSQKLGQTLGRIFAATKAGDELGSDIVGKAEGRAEALRAGGIRAAEDAAAKGAAREAKTAAPIPQDMKWNLRADQIIDETGVPVAMPLLESQLDGAVPLIDIALAKKLLKRDQSAMSRLSRAWAAEAEELDVLLAQRGQVKGKAAVALEKSIAAKNASLDWLLDGGQKLNRLWKMAVLFRLGYPVRVVLDDHWRIWSQIGAGTFYAQNGSEAISNNWYNMRGRKIEGKAQAAQVRERLEDLQAELNSEHIANFGARLEESRKVSRQIGGYKGQITRLRKQMEDVETKASLGFADRTQTTELEKKVADLEAKIADRQATLSDLQATMGDRTPEQIKSEVDELHELLKQGPKAFRDERRRLGTADVEIGDGMTIPGSMAGGHGSAMRGAASSKETFEYQMKGVEDFSYGGKMVGSYRTIAQGQPGYHGALADALSNQFRNSQVAMHFVKGGTVDEFALWVKQPEQAQLRKRLSHYAHDPEDWGERVKRVVEDYIPNEKVAARLREGKQITEKFLRREVQEFELPPAVHGREVADTLGTSAAALGIGRVINKTFSWLAEVPTDRLSRHPFFNSMYKMHAREMAETRRIAYRETGEKFTQADLLDIERYARQMALADVKRTLFDMSAHSHAAHVMRFVSPFFAAHQEVLSRWWRIVGENPGVVRRFQQAFDAPRHAGVVVDENGEPVEPGAPVSYKHSILLPDFFPGDSSWSISENSFNLILQGGLTNPGAGPIVQVPLEHLAVTQADNTNVAKVARVFNPFPPGSPAEAAFPATFKRFMAVTYGAGILDGDYNAVGKREWFSLMHMNIQDATTDFKLKNGREPTSAEADAILERAKKGAMTDAMLRFLNNTSSPFPARPNSKFSVIQDGWWRLREVSRQKFPNDWEAANEWSTQQFREKYGEAYFALVDSAANNPSGLDGSPAEVSAYKRYKTILGTVDPRLHRGILGPYAADGETERTPEGVNFFKNAPLADGSSDRYFSTDEPRPAFEESMAKRGWRKYEELTSGLNVLASQQGLASYLDSPELVELKKVGLDAIKEENYAFREDIEDFDSGRYETWLSDMEKLVQNRSLQSDPLRSDIKTLETYLSVRKYFEGLFQRRMDAGLGGPDAQASEPIKAAYTQVIGKLVESNTYWESNFFNGVVEYDPFLIGN